ncbi:4'-phosphopantetheinyl transferase superfamily protein [Streptomyces sp. NPDC047072]|uniref:4'-phosphopantetheinyl transferase family protein n=1 Tax=Streptomyces sp. NPDC047072 TaxID=3154809 RepID=UPI003411ADE2
MDVERVPGPKRAEDATRVLHASELRDLARLSVEARPGGFARCWTRKEAYRKATGEGLSCEAPRDRYLGAGPPPARLPGRRIIDVDVPDGWAAACVVRTAGDGSVRR